MINSQIEEIKSRLDIVELIGEYARLQKAGTNFRANCPFHNEKTPSFFVSPARQIWRCFGACGEGGDIFSFLMKIEGVEFADALNTLAQRAGVVLKKEDPKLRSERQKYYEIAEKAAQFFEQNLENTPAGMEAKNYLKKRGLKDETIKEFRLGWASESWNELLKFLAAKDYKAADIEKAGLAAKKQNEDRWFDRFRGRIIFPIFDLQNQVIGFGGRIFRQNAENEPKYLNTPQTLIYDKGKLLYGLNFAKNEIRRLETCVLVEGYMDLILSRQDGLKNCAAVSGTALTPYQLAVLKRLGENLVLAFDMDEAGQKAASRGIDLARNLGFNIKIMVLPEGKDPADFVLSHAGKLIELSREARPITEYYFERTFNRLKPDSAEGKREIAKVLLPQIKLIANKIEQAHWVAELAGRLGVREEAITEEMKKYQSPAASGYAFFEPAGASRMPAANKDREEVLGDHLVRLFLKHGENFAAFNELNFNFFKRYNFALALEHFQKYADEENFDRAYKEAPEQMKDYLNKLELESQNFEVQDIGAEIKFCLQSLKRHFLDRQMEEIKIALERVEKNGDRERISDLMARFNQLLFERQKLEKNEKT